VKRFLRVRKWPSSIRIPIIVVVLMVGISVVISERVLDQLSKTQTIYLQGLASAYLDGLVASITPSVLRQDSWEIFDGIERLKPSTNNILATETVVTDRNGNVLAANDPTRRQTLEPIDPDFSKRFENRGVRIDPETKSGYVQRTIFYQNKIIGTVYAVFDITPLLQERRRILVTLLATNTLITSMLGLVGFFAVRRMIRPMQVLETHLLDAAAGAATIIKDDEFPSADGEAARAYRAHNSLVKSARERQGLAKQLAEEERLSSLGRLASGMAHEINNPLGGLMNAVDTLREHGENHSVRMRSLELIQRGLAGIREVVEATLATYRPERLSRPVERSDFFDLQLLVRPELRRKKQTLEIDLPDVIPERREWPAGPIRQAALNLLLNAIAASPENSKVGLRIAITQADLEITVSDQGEGMPKAVSSILQKENRSAPAQGKGLGLWVVRQIADDLGARLQVSYETKLKTEVRLCLPYKRKEVVHAT